MSVYGTSVYGGTYGTSLGLPTSALFDYYDFCHPTEATMFQILSYGGTTTYRFGAPNSYYSGNDYYLQSNDSVMTGLRIDVPMVHGQYTLQFSFLPDTLPPDFSALSTNRFFVSIYNYGGYAVGLLFTEEAGIALAVDPTTIISTFVDSDRIMDASAYYIVRITVNEATGVANLYITRKDVYAVTGIHELRYTFAAPISPVGLTDHLKIEAVGTAADPTVVYLDCLRLSSQLLLGNQRPVAVIADDDRFARVNGYASFDGRGSYDPDSPPQPLNYVWTVTDAPAAAEVWIEGVSVSPASSSGWVNYLTGPAGTFTDIRAGDLVVGTLFKSPVVYVSDDTSVLAAAGDVFEAGTTLRWRVLSQSGWGGSRVSGTMLIVEDSGTTPPGIIVDDAYYLVTSVAAGAWTGHDGELAVRSSVTGLWSFIVPPNNTVIYIKTDYDCYRYAGAGLWSAESPHEWELPYWDGRMAHVAAYFATAAGIYDVELIVGDGVRASLPALAVLNCQVVESELGVIPDMGFLWKHLPGEFWDIVENREVFETFWSGCAQIFSGLLVELWQHQFSQDLFRVQRTFQRHWLNYDLLIKEPNCNELPATIENSINVGDYSATPSIIPPSVYAYDLGGVLLTPPTDANYLVLDGTLYHILRTTMSGGHSIVITEHAMPSDPERSHYWRISPTVTSQLLNFENLLISAEDEAIFEVRDEDDNIEDIGCYVYGVRGSVLAFDDTDIAVHLSDDTKTVTLKSIRRRARMSINILVQSIPRLQEVIDYGNVVGATSPSYEGRHFYITENDETTNSLEFVNMWKPIVARGEYGETTALDVLEDVSASFFTSLGPTGTDLSGYVIDVEGKRYRLRVVLNDNAVGFEEQCIDSGLVGLSWQIERLDTPPDSLWAEVTHLDNRPTIEANFGSLIGFTLDDLDARTDDLDYLSAVRGLWYYVYNARTLYATRVASQIILGLPFAEMPGTIIDIQEYDATRTRVLVRDSADQSTVRSYVFLTAIGVALNPSTGVAYVAGDTISQFAPLSQGVTVVDYIESPQWFAPYVGSGDMYEVEKLSTVGVLLSADIFDLTNLQFLLQFLRQHRVSHRDFFAAVSRELEVGVSVGDAILLGPIVPSGYTFPDTWPSLTVPFGWADAPHELPRAVITDHYPTTPAVPRNHRTEDFGGLHFRDVVGFVPNVWTGAWPTGNYYGNHAKARSEGDFTVNYLDPRGRCCHLVGYTAHVNALSDEGFESGVAIGAPTSRWDLVGTPAVAAKVSAPLPVHSGSNSAFIVDVAPGEGIEQTGQFLTFHRDYQLAAKVWIYVLSGQAHVELIDTSTSTVLAEQRCGGGRWLNRWKQVCLHVWTIDEYGVGATHRSTSLRITTGPVGGEFFVDDGEVYSEGVPWTQFGVNSFFANRTGGASDGALPDEDLSGMYVIDHAGGVPVVGAGWVAGAASAPDRMRTRGPATAPLPPADWSAPGVSSTSWHGPNYGPYVETWDAATGYPGYTAPTPSVLVGVALPLGWYTRIEDLIERRS